jgi:hypothetical protein
MSHSRLPPDLEHARQPSQLITGICLDCGPEDLVGVRRYITETHRCATCGSGSVLKIGAIKELKRQIHLRTMSGIAVLKEARGTASHRHHRRRR